MNIKLFTEPFINLVTDLSLVNPRIDDLYSRVGLVIRNYSKSRNIKFSEFRLLDLLGLNNKLHDNYLQFIARISRPEDRPEERHKRFKEEARANSYNLLEKIVGCDLRGRKTEQNQCFLISNIPEFLIPVVTFLTENYWRKSYKEAANFLGEAGQLEKLQLTENGCYLLPILLRVVEDYQIKHFEGLFLDHRQEVYRSIKSTIPYIKLNSIKATFSCLRRRLKLEIPRDSKAPLDINNLPPTLKMQWELFEKRALIGWRDQPEMLSLAAQNRIEISVLEKSTIDTYRNVLLMAMTYIPFKTDLDIRDLLRLEAVEINIDGVLTTKLCNPLVEIYREREQQKHTRHKRIGFDSVVFSLFITAIKTIANYNGIFHLQVPFRKSYTAMLDRGSRQKIKGLQKQAFPLEWIDEMIAKLEPEFIKIIRENKFKLEATKWKPSETRQALRFCFFYVTLVTLRYTGFRQQCIRNCVYGKHIVFNSDDSITFRWEADEIKNDKLYKITFDPNKHNWTHGILIRTLKLCHSNVYKYFLRLKNVTTENQFFLKINNHNKPQNFKARSSSSFNSTFVSWSRMFIKEDDKINELKLALKPHDFRGFAADWYFHLNPNVEQTANLLGDSPITIAREYLRNDQHIADGDLDEINRILKQRELHNSEEILFTQRLQIQEQLQRADERAATAERRADELAVLLDSTTQKFLLIQQQSAQNYSELLGRFEALSQTSI